MAESVASESLSWDLRLKIAIGAAWGLAFLHTSNKQVFYRIFNVSHVLLDGNYNAKLSGFGLEILHVATKVMGTYGYATPEYVATGHLHVKSNVSGFGVVLLEMLTGLRVFDPERPIGQHSLVDYAKPILSVSEESKLISIVDARMEGQYSLTAALQAARLTLRCLEIEPIKWPSMKEVVEELEQIAAIEI